MVEIVLRLIILALRFLEAVVTVLGDVVETDFMLTNGVFTSNGLIAVRNAIRRRRHQRPGPRPEG